MATTGFEFRVALPVDLLPIKARKLRLQSCLTHSEGVKRWINTIFQEYLCEIECNEFDQYSNMTH